MNTDVLERESLKQKTERTLRNKIKKRCYYACSANHCTELVFRSWGRQMKAGHDRQFQTTIPLSQYKAWNNCLSTLKKELGKIPEDYRGWSIFFEYATKMHTRHRHVADVIIRTGTMTFVLEFKMKLCSAPDTADASQVWGYTKTLRNHYKEENSSRVVVPLVVLSRTEGLDGHVQNGNHCVRFCSGDKLAETIADEMEKRGKRWP